MNESYLNTNSFRANFQKYDNITVTNNNFLFFEIDENVFENNDIIVDEHIDFEIFDKMNFTLDKCFDKFVISVSICKINEQNDVIFALMLNNTQISYNDE